MSNKLLRVACLSVVSGLAALGGAGCKGSAPGDGSGSGGDGVSPSGTGGSGAPLCSSDVSKMNVGGGFGFNNGLSPQLGPTTVMQAEPPPAISGGTLRVLRDGTTAVASDPDRDRVYVVDLTTRAVTATVDLQKGDEPGRIAEDGAGRVHVALRHGGALATIVPATGEIVERRVACAAPRGVAYQDTTDTLHVACAGGELVSFPAAGGAATRTLKLDGDLRDVIVDGGKLLITRFRSAQLVTVDASGAVMDRRSMPVFRSQPTRGGQAFSASVAWRAVAAPAGGAVVLHQRGVDDPIQPAAGGYGGFDPCNAIVQTAVTTVGADGQAKGGPALAGLVVAVDMALSPDGSRIAIVAAGNAHNSFSADSQPTLPRVFVTDMASATDQVIGCRSDGQHGPCLPGRTGGLPIPLAALPENADQPPTSENSGGSPGTDVGTGSGTGAAGSSGVSTGAGGDTGGPGGGGGSAPPSCAFDGSTFNPDPSVPPNVVGEPVAIAYAAGVNGFVVQSREPAMLQLPGGAHITLATDSRADTGHTMFHANAGSFVACASCHAEGNEDGRVWKFACEGARRTQSLQTGLRGTEPFHWGGEERDFSALVRDVFVGRMSGPLLANDQLEATLRWIDVQPRPALSPPADHAAVERGRSLFNDGARAACASCHTGARLTNSTSVDVGTGGMFQVPSLVGIGSRGPYMHNGCATTLRDRFGGACGGGDKHGVTSGMSDGELADLVAYLNTL